MPARSACQNLAPSRSARRPQAPRLQAAAMWLALAAPLAGADDPADLDVSHIAVFSSGVAYFERSGVVDGTAEVELRFRTDQINDILKSLVVQDFDGGTVGVVSYASQDPLARTLRSFFVDLTGNPTLAELLNQLRGEPIEVRGARALTGVIVGVETKQTIVGEQKVEEPLLNVLTDEGMRQVSLNDIEGLRLVNDKVDAELRKALTTLASAHDADKKSVTLRFFGSGQRKVEAAYLLEAPIWKTSYRLVLSDEKKPFIQGWATVENATEEDWRDVRLSLVSGRPISFRMDLYTPLYVPRPLEELELYASLRPPTYEGGMNQDDKDEEQRRAGQMIFGSRGAADRARSVLPRGGSRAAPSAGVALEALGYAGAAGRKMDLQDAGVASVAEAADAGELFEYVIATPVSIPRQHSAMLPIVNQAVTGEKVSIYNPATHAKHPLNGLQLTNSTELNLMQGPVTIFDEGVYAGDAKLPDLKPGEKRLVAYALDLGVEVLVNQRPRPDEIVSLRIAKGVLIHTHKYADEREYVIKNKLERDREVLVEQAYGDEWKLLEPEKPYERAPGLSRFMQRAAAGKTESLVVKLEQVTDQALALRQSSLDQIQFYLRTRVITPKVREALERVIAMRTELDRAERERKKASDELEESIRDQARIRENLKTLDRNSDAYRRQEQKFDEAETKIERLRAQIAQLASDVESRQRALEDYLLTLSVE